MRVYEAEGLVGLCDAKSRSGNRTRRIGLEELAIIGPIVEGYAHPLRPSQKIIYERVESAFEDANKARESQGLTPLVMPSRETIRQEIRKLDPFHTVLARMGQEAARKKFAPVGIGLQVKRPLERVEIDEWTIDLISLFAKSGILEHLTKEEKELLGLNKKKIRWILTVAICAATRCIVAMRLSRSASKNSAVQTLEMITQDKGIWADTFGAISPWNMGGPPELIVTDNGSSFISVAMRTAMQDLGIRAERCPTGFPQMRARIERLFGTMSSSLMPLLSGRTFSDVITKGDADPEDGAALTPEELSEALVRWVVDVYHNRPHEGLDGETPANCWNRLVETYGVQPAPDMRRRRLVFGTRTTRTVTAKGIRVFGVRYHSEPLARWFVHAPEREVEVRWHRDDIGAIEVNFDGEWHEVPSVFEEVRGVHAEVWHGAVRALRASFRDEAESSRPVGASRRNPWNAGTLEWSHNVPEEQWGVRSIPFITSRYPLWDQPQIVERMDAGRFYLSDTKYGYRETIVTSVLDARPQHVQRITGPAWITMMAAAFTGGAFIFPTFSMYVPAIISGAFAIVCVLYWLWTTTAQVPEEPTSDVGLGLRLPRYASGPNAPGWWAVWITMLGDATAFTSLVFGFFFYWTASPDFPPTGADHAGGAALVAAAVLLSLSWLATRSAKATNRHGNVRQARILLAVGMACTAAGGAGLYLAVADLAPTSHAYPAIVCALAVWLGAHLGLGLIAQGYSLARSLAGHTTPIYDADLTNTTLLWHFIVVQALITSAVIGLLPGWMT
ncbi:Mu transposase C-terminal domain-containing protein [Palleronia salina]|nr:Mu transposase C-terminal domain-containing protein [Palleronia salina]